MTQKIFLTWKLTKNFEESISGTGLDASDMRWIRDNPDGAICVIDKTVWEEDKLHERYTRGNYIYGVQVPGNEEYTLAMKYVLRGDAQLYTFQQLKAMGWNGRES